MKKSIVALFILFFTPVLNAQLLAQTYQVTIETSVGKIKLLLYDNTPQHRDNLVKLIKDGFYNGTLFHRVIPEFVIQGGDPDSKTAKPGQVLGDGDLSYKIPAEFVKENIHKRGAVGMARDNNPKKESSACQFYIVVGKKYTDAELDKVSQRRAKPLSAEEKEIYKTIGGVPHLDGSYTVFGMVTNGMNIVDKIAQLPRNSNDRPNEDIKMIKVTVKKKKRFLFF